jgi:hypothetical protein
MSRKVLVSAIFAVLIAVAFATTLRSSGEGTYTTVIDSGLTPVLSSEHVAQIAFERLRGMATTPGVGEPKPIQNVSLHAVRESDVHKVEPNSPVGDSVSGIVWVVRAEGTFVSARGRSPELIIADSGYLLVDDGSGQIIGMGMP